MRRELLADPLLPVEPELALALPGKMAGVGMTLGRRRSQRRQLLVARCEAECAARVERTAGRWVDERGWRALDRHERRELPVDARHRVEQAPGVRVLRGSEDLLRRP